MLLVRSPARLPLLSWRWRRRVRAFPRWPCSGFGSLPKNTPFQPCAAFADGPRRGV